MKQTMCPLKHRGRSHKPRLCQTDSTVSRLRGPTGVHPLRPRAVGQVFNDACSHAAGQTQSIDHLRFGQLQGSADTRHSADDTKNGRWMEARFVNAGGCHRTQTTGDFNTQGDAAQQRIAVERVALSDCQQRRHDDRTCVHRATLVSVVKIFAMGSDAVDKSGCFNSVAFWKTEHGAGSRLLNSGQCGQHIVFMACGHANTGHIHQQTPRHRQGQRVQLGLGRCHRRGQSDGNRWA